MAPGVMEDTSEDERQGTGTEVKVLGYSQGCEIIIVTAMAWAGGLAGRLAG